MNSGKSIDVLKVAHNYEEQGKPVVLLTSGVDTRSGRGTIASRIGLERKVYPVMKDTDVYEYVKNIDHRIYCVLIDEAQFLSKEHVLQLTRIVDELNIPVMTFGLKNDFRNELFEGSKYLLIYADKIEALRHKLDSVIAEATGKTREEVEKDTERDCWLTAEEARNYGLLSKIIREKKEII